MSNLVLSTRFISARIDAVFDVYKEYSVKNAERENGDVKTVFILKKKKNGNNIICQWSTFLGNSTKETEHMKLLASEWQKKS